MKTVNEINTYILTLENELIGARAWADRAYNQYCKDRKEWGEGDYGETSAAYEVVNELENKIKALEWVLEG